MKSFMKGRTWFNGYYKGIREANKAWSAVVIEQLGGDDSLTETILDEASIRLGESCIQRPPAAR